MAALCLGSGIHKVLEILYQERPLESTKNIDKYSSRSKTMTLTGQGNLDK